MPAIGKMAEQLEKFPKLEEPNQTGFGLAFGEPFFDYLEKNPDKNGLFAKAMAEARGRESWNAIATSYDWSQLKNGLVDVSSYFVSISTHY
jgi:hypothetical protein